MGYDVLLVKEVRVEGSSRRFFSRCYRFEFSARRYGVVGVALFPGVGSGIFDL